MLTTPPNPSNANTTTTDITNSPSENDFWSRLPLTVATNTPNSTKIEQIKRPTVPTLGFKTGVSQPSRNNQGKPSRSSPHDGSPSRKARINLLQKSSKNTSPPLTLPAPTTPTKTPIPIVVPLESAPYQLTNRYRDLKENGEKSSGLFVAEGPETIKLLLESDLIIESLLLKTSVHERLKKDIEIRLNRLSNNNFTVITVNGQSNYTKHVGYSARGALGVGEVPQSKSVEWLHNALTTTKSNQQQWRILAIDNSNNPANIGSMLRTANALEVDAVLLSDNCCDPWSRRSVRVSMGHCFSLPIIQCSSLKDDLLYLQDVDNVVCYSAVVQKGANESIFHQKNSKYVSRWCCVVGSEHEGVSEEILNVTKKIRIPMKDGVDSLSITSATSILLAQLRQVERTEEETSNQENAVPTIKEGMSESSSNSDIPFTTTIMLCTAVFALGILVGMKKKVN
jgi:tRNA G18 (ribose-2'-O)-methylase SpoU